MVLEAGLQQQLEGMGTTLVGALQNPAGLDIASVADSWVYMLDTSGLQAITDDQRVNEVAGRLLDENAAPPSNKRRMSQAPQHCCRGAVGGRSTTGPRLTRLLRSATT